MHAFTGYDSTSAFHGKGKAIFFHLVKENKQHLMALKKLGQSFNTDTELIAQLEALVCQVYKSQTESVDKARYLLFCTGSKEEASLPPTQDALTQHVKRANYQLCIWRHCFKSQPEVVMGGQLKVMALSSVWMTKAPAPDDILQSFCNCDKMVCGKRCLCKAKKLSCIAGCTCIQNEKDCLNEFMMTNALNELENPLSDDDSDSDIDL